MRESVILYRTYERALAARKALARSGAMTLGVSPTTVAAFLADSWEVWGDGRRLVEPKERLLLMLAAVEDGPLPSTLGLAQALVRFVAWNAGTEVLQQALASLAGGSAEGLPSRLEDALTEREHAALAAIASYVRALGAHGLVEPGEAAQLLASRMDPAAIEVADELFETPAVMGWLGAIGGVPASADPRPLPPLPKGVEARFAFPAGATAVVRAIKEEVESALVAATEASRTDARVVVCSPDPVGLFEDLAPALMGDGIACALKGLARFGETPLGRALKAVRKLMAGEGSWRQAATDFAYSPLSGIKPSDAQRMNAQWRGDRLIEAAQAVGQLREASLTFAPMEALLRCADMAALDELKQAVAESQLVPKGPATLERSAFQSLRSLIEAAEGLDVPVPLGVLEEALVVPLSAKATMGQQAGDGPIVEFCALRSMDGLAPESAFAVIIADMTDAAFGSGRSRSTLDGLAEKLGAEEPPSRFEEWRAAFACAESAATARFVAMAPLRDSAQEPTYPAFLFDELVGVLPDGGALVDVDDEGLYQLPQRYAERALRCGEEAMVAGLGQSFAEPAEIEQLPAPVRGQLSELPMERFLRMVPDGSGAVPVLSPSAIEAYVQCPYQWFVARKVGANSLDEGFGPLEKGTFAHQVYKRLFDQLAESGICKVDDHTLPQVLAAFEAVFEAVLAEQSSQEAGDRMAPIDSLEQQQVALLKGQLRESLRHMTRLPQAFIIHEHEYDLRPEDGIDYAGARVTGRVDRIDVDEEEKRFAVLDYKGSLIDHEAGFDDGDDLDSFELPHKVQALIYAQALRSKLAPMACVGALYLSYRAKEASKLAAGSYDSVGYGTDAATKRSQVSASFDAFLDAVERQIAPRIEALRAGRIAPDPAPGACFYCPVPYCESRC